MQSALFRRTCEEKKYRVLWTVYNKSYLMFVFFIIIFLPQLHCLTNGLRKCIPYCLYSLFAWSTSMPLNPFRWPMTFWNYIRFCLCLFPFQTLILFRKFNVKWLPFVSTWGQERALELSSVSPCLFDSFLAISLQENFSQLVTWQDAVNVSLLLLGWFSNRTGTSVGDGKACGKD